MVEQARDTKQSAVLMSGIHGALLILLKHFKQESVHRVFCSSRPGIRYFFLLPSRWEASYLAWERRTIRSFPLVDALAGFVYSASLFFLNNLYIIAS